LKKKKGRERRLLKGENKSKTYLVVINLGEDTRPEGRGKKAGMKNKENE